MRKNKEELLKLCLLLFLLWMMGQREYAQQRANSAQGKRADAELLGKALDYFSSQKYHESLLILQELDKKYRLNPRYKAYLGVCYYYEWNYEQAAKNLSEAIPKLVNFAPQERSFYYWAQGESYFYLQEYAKAIPAYLSMLGLCHPNEKPDAHYRLGFCYMFAEEWGNSWFCFTSALKEYEAYRDKEEVKARMVQINNMLKGIEPKVAMWAYKRIKDSRR